MSKRDEQLTLAQVGRIRATHAKQASNILGRMGKFAEDELYSPKRDEDGNKVKIKMSANQIKAGLAVINVVMPAQQSTITQTIEPPRNPEDLREAVAKARQAVIESLTPDEIMNAGTIEH